MLDQPNDPIAGSGQPNWYIGGDPSAPGVLRSLMTRANTTFTKPYAPYRGKRVAQLQPKQKQAREIIEATAKGRLPKKQHAQTMESLLKNLGASSRQPADKLLRSATGEVRTKSNTPYMASLQDNVLNRLEDRMVRNLREKVLPAIDNERIAKGRFLQPGRFADHSRALRDLQDTLAGQEAEVLHKGVYEAEQMGRLQKERQLEGARITGGLESADLNRQLDAASKAQSALTEQQRRSLEGANQMNVMGEAERALNQEGLNISAQDFAQMQGYPGAQLEREAAIARGFNPRAPYEVPAMPSVGNSLATQLAGAGMQLMAMNRPQPQQQAPFAKGGHVKVAESAKHGRYGDTEMAYIPQNLSNRLDRMIGGPSFNPETGHKEYYLAALASAIPILYDLFKKKPEPAKPEFDDYTYGWGDGQSAQHSKDMGDMRGFGFNTLGEYTKANNMAQDAGFGSLRDFNREAGPKVDRDAEYATWRQQHDAMPMDQREFPNSTPEQAAMLRSQAYAHGGRVTFADGGSTGGGLDLLNSLLMDPNASMAEQAVRQKMGQQQPQAPQPSIDEQMAQYDQQLNANPLDRGAQAAMSSLNKRKADKQMQQSMAGLNTPPRDPWGSFLMKMGAGLMGNKVPDLGVAAGAGADAYMDAQDKNAEHQRRTAELHKAMQETYRVEELERAKAEALSTQNQAENDWRNRGATETGRHNKEMEAIARLGLQGKGDSKKSTELVPVGGGNPETAAATGQPMVELEKEVDGDEINALKSDLNAIDDVIKNAQTIVDHTKKSGFQGWGAISRLTPDKPATWLSGNTVSRTKTRNASANLVLSLADRLKQGRLLQSQLATIRETKPEHGTSVEGNISSANEILAKAKGDRVAVEADAVMSAAKLPPAVRVMAYNEWKKNTPTWVEDKYVAPKTTPLDYLPTVYKQHIESFKKNSNIGGQATSAPSGPVDLQSRLSSIDQRIAALKGEPAHDEAYQERLRRFDAAGAQDERERNGSY